MDGESLGELKPTQRLGKRNGDIEGNCLPRGRKHQLDIQYQMFSHENIIQLTVYKLNGVYLYIQENMCVYIYLYSNNSRKQRLLI